MDIQEPIPLHFATLTNDVNIGAAAQAPTANLK